MFKKRKADGDADASINRTTGMLEVCFKLAMRTRKLNSIPYIEHLKEDNTREGFLTPSQFQELLPHVPADLKDFTEWLYACGMRKGEATLLRWEMLDEKPKGGPVLRIPGYICKNKKGRTLPLDKKLAAIIERRKAVQYVAVDGVTSTKPCPFIFHRNGAPVGDFKKSWKTATKAAGLPGILVHDMRRSAVKNLVDSGCPQLIAMKVSGHKSEAMFKRYAITVDEEVRAGMETKEAYCVAAAAKPVAVIGGSR
jgi:integrase